MSKHKIPNYVFIIPYRNRQQDMEQYLKLMPQTLTTIEGEYEIIFSHQKDKRPFNRGAMKNLGFYYVKKTYPNHYKNIQLIFQDVDIIPKSNNVAHYETKFGEIKHYYGFNFALGGFLSIRAKDFESINGYPNFWGWGYEDNTLQERATIANITINREEWYSLGHKNYYYSATDNKRIIDNNIIKKFKNTRNHPENGISQLKNIAYKIQILQTPYNIKLVHFFKWEIPKESLKTTFRYDTVVPNLKDINVKHYQMKHVMNNIIKKKKNNMNIVKFDYIDEDNK